MRYITQQELDNLATMANQCLLPVVLNNQVDDVGAGFTRWDPANPWYDKVVGGPTGIAVDLGGGGGLGVKPAPAYSFKPNTFTNLVAAGAHYDSSGNYAVTLPADSEYNYQQGANDLTLHDPTPGLGNPGGFDYTYSTNNFYLANGTAVVLTGTPNSLVTATLGQSPYTLLKEMNRIRGDAMALIFGNPAAYPLGEALFLNPAAVCSGPWVVGVNDQRTYCSSPYGYGFFNLLDGALPAGLQANFCMFNSVQFVTTADKSPTLYTAQQAQVPVQDFFAAWVGTQTFHLAHAGDLLVEFQHYLIWTGGGTPPATAPLVTDFTINVSGLTFTWTTSVVDATAGIYRIYGKANAVPVTAGTFAWTLTEITPPANYADTGSPNGQAQVIATLIFSTTTSGTDTPVVHPKTGAKIYSLPDMPANCQFSMNGRSGPGDTPTATSGPAFVVTDPTIAGVWIAKTLPVPGVNVFIDQDILIGDVRLIPSANHPGGIMAGVSGAGQMDGTNDAPWASSMRQAVPVETGTPDVTVIKDVRAAKPGITTRPSKWPVRRDSDFVPYDLGFNTTADETGFVNYVSTFYKSQVMAPGVLNYYNVSVPSVATGVKIRLIKSGTMPGWKAGTFQYGDAVGNALDIYVRQAGFPVLPSTYDFKTTNNAVTIDGTGGSDGGAGYLAAVSGGGFSFAVMNPGSSAVTLDIYVETDRGTPKRIYPPNAGECFSYIIDGTPGMYFGLWAPSWGSSGSKPIPQSGYCLFKARATRVPTHNAYGITVTPGSGPALTVTLGQNIDNGDGTITFTPFVVGGSNLTITIPAFAGTSEDVNIFIPVLAGNEVVYQCSGKVIVEVWANWQPIWFNQRYSRAEFPFQGGEAPAGTTAFQYALSFVNDFDASKPGWVPPYYSPDTGSAYHAALGSVVVFPLFGQLYDDTVKLLVLLGGVLPTGIDAGGAGGGGSAGGGPGGAGDAGGFGAL